MQKVVIIVFPGSNREVDVARAIDVVCGGRVEIVYVSSRESSLPRGVSHVILPGGFSYGDYLRGGALAKVSPVMQAVVVFAKQGGSVLGICNGFQILTEIGLLEGGLVRNLADKFICRQVGISVEGGGSAGFFSEYQQGEVLQVPIAHGEGRFVADDNTLQALEREQRVVLRYCENVNGSMNAVAGICSKDGRVAGFMPHFENAVGRQNEALSQDGTRLFRRFMAER